MCIRHTIMNIQIQNGTDFFALFLSTDFKLSMADKNLATSAVNATSADGKRSAVKTVSGREVGLSSVCRPQRAVVAALSLCWLWLASDTDKDFIYRWV